jgi:hypothetical protein
MLLRTRADTLKSGISSMLQRCTTVLLNATGLDAELHATTRYTLKVEWLMLSFKSCNYLHIYKLIGSQY